MTDRTPQLAPEALFRALEAAGQVMFEYDPGSRQLAWCDENAARSLLSLEDESSACDFDNFLSRIGDRDLVQREQIVEEARTRRGPYATEYAIDCGLEEIRWIEERGTWLPLPDGEKLIAVVRRIDDQKQREAALHYLASYDELTGQLNRVRFKEYLSRAVAAATNDMDPAALLLVGIDDVGSINNDFGFDIADQVIVDVAGRIANVLGDGSVFGRVAGTKFGVLLSDGSRENVSETARQIMSAMRESVVLTRAGGIGISVCVGATFLSCQTRSASAAMAEVEAAFDGARRQGPSSFETFTETTETISRRRRNTEMSDVILTALNDRRVYLAYQPIVADVSETPTKFECLVRMRNEDGSEIPAPAFIPAAERLGLVHLIDRRVLELATKALFAHPNISLNVNLSWETVKDLVWAEGYLSHLRANALVCDRLTIELTETQMVEAIDSSVEFVAAIKEFGCRFAIDDFGAGYTSFRNLKALDIDVLKIDGSFVAGVAQNRDNQLFVRTLLDLARNFGMQTVAEWVDNDADAQLLKALGLDYLQGFYIGRPGELSTFGLEDKARLAG